MSMTDPVADLLTRIRNAAGGGKKSVKVPYSGIKKNICRVLKEQGFITDYAPEMEGKRAVIRIELKYGPDGEQVLRQIRRISKPGRRVYAGADELPNVLNGLGVAVLSTSGGVISSIEARKLKLGGEVLCEIW